MSAPSKEAIARVAKELTDELHRDNVLAADTDISSAFLTHLFKKHSSAQPQDWQIQIMGNSEYIAIDNRIMFSMGEIHTGNQESLASRIVAAHNATLK